MIIHEQLFWVMVGAFYLLPHIKFIKRSEGYVFVSLKGRSVATLVSSPFETIRGVLAVINPMAPYRAVFRCNWGIADTSRNADVRRSWSQICRTNKKLHGIRIVATLGWVVLFIVGPVLTWQLGLGQTIVLLVPVWLSLYVGASYFLLADKLEFNTKNVYLILFECLVCPGYLPALPKILTADAPVSVDMMHLVKRYGEPKTWVELKAVLERRIEAEIYHDPSLEKQLNDYRTAILR